MLPDQVREGILAAVCGDRWLFDRLVLKGGNALALIYRIGQRVSLDLDFSIEGDFEVEGPFRFLLFIAFSSIIKVIVYKRRARARGVLIQ